MKDSAKMLEAKAYVKTYCIKLFRNTEITLPNLWKLGYVETHPLDYWQPTKKMMDFWFDRPNPEKKDVEANIEYLRKMVVDELKFEQLFGEYL